MTLFLLFSIALIILQTNRKSAESDVQPQPAGRNNYG